MTVKNIVEGTLYGPRFYILVQDGADSKYTLGPTGEKIYSWNPYYMNSVTNTSLPGVYFGHEYWIAGQGAGLSAFPPNMVGLQSKLVNKIRHFDFNLTVELAQSRQTYSMILDNVKSIGLAARDVRHCQFGDALRRLGSQFSANEILISGSKRRNPYLPSRNTLGNRKPKRLSTKDFANRWLEIQYGWVPLLDDVTQMGDVLTSLNHQRNELLRVSASQIGHFSASLSPAWNIPGVYKARQYLYYEFREDIDTPRLLGLDDPWSVAWELLPYSFVVDWFLPVGSFFENLSMIPRLKGRSLTTKIIKSIYRGTVNDEYKQYFPIKPSTEGEMVEMTREVSAMGVPLAFPRFKPLDKALSPKHLYNALALARQHFD
jgi:hypothetical protein